MNKRSRRKIPIRVSPRPEGDRAKDSVGPTENFSEPTVARVPLMITNKMRERLRELGHEDATIRLMTPAEAWAILNGVAEP
jgi:hypothetical protein